jgi:cation-transporting ATPase 13A1
MPLSLITVPAIAAGSCLLPPCACVRASLQATLTGESVPQMKDAVTASPRDTRLLEMEGSDRVHVLFSGTALISALDSPPEAVDSDDSGSGGAGSGASALPVTPDGGCLCYALRTGFSSSQGALVQLIEFSTQKVSGDSRETRAALLILFVFALCAAGYVLKKGLDKGYVLCLHRRSRRVSVFHVDLDALSLSCHCP